MEVLPPIMTVNFDPMRTSLLLPEGGKAWASGYKPKKENMTD